MKKFQFTLQALRTLRERQEQTARQGYAQALQAWEQARSKVRAVQQELAAAWTQVRQRTLENCPAGDLNRLRAYCQAVEQRKQICEHGEKAARHKVDHALTRLLAARQALAVVDKFHDRAQRRYDREAQRHEQHVLDEIVQHQDALATLLNLTPQTLWS